MPTNTPIPTLATGNVLSATQWNYLTALNGALALFRTSSVGITGATPPVAAAPNFYMQAGYTPVTFSAASGTLTFPAAFPNGILCVIANINVATGASQLAFNTASVSSVTWQAYSPSGTALNAAAYVNWIAIGW